MVAQHGMFLARHVVITRLFITTSITVPSKPYAFTIRVNSSTCHNTLDLYYARRPGFPETSFPTGKCLISE